MATTVIRPDQLQPNPNVGRTPYQHAAEYTASSGGAFQTLRLCQRTAKIANEVRNLSGQGYSPVLSDIDSKCFAGWAIMGVPRLVGMTGSVAKTVADASKPSQVPGEKQRKIEKAVRDTTEMGALVGHLAGYVAKTRAFAPVANTLDLISDSTDLKIAATDLRCAVKMSKQADSEQAVAQVKKNVQHTKMHAMIRVAKAVCAVVSGILGVSLMLLGGPIVPAIILIGLSLASTVLSIYAHFYKESRPFKMIDFFENRQVRPLQA